MSPARLRRIALVLLILTALPSSVFASLGGSATTVDADRVHVQGALMRIERTNAYALHEIRSAAGTAIREYLDSSGTVFAVAWDGPWMPDLQQVLGEHFEHFQAAMRAHQQTRRVRGVVAIDDAGLVVQMTGHPRAFTGRVYLSARLPAGVQPETIR